MEDPRFIWSLLLMGVFTMAMPVLFLAIGQLRGNREPAVLVASNRLAIWLGAVSSFFLAVGIYAGIYYATADASLQASFDAYDPIFGLPTAEGSFYGPCVLLLIPAVRRRAWAVAILTGIPLLGGLLKLSLAWDWGECVRDLGRGVIAAGGAVLLVISLLNLRGKERMEAAIVLGGCSAFGFLLLFAGGMYHRRYGLGSPLAAFESMEPLTVIVLWMGGLLLIRPVRTRLWLHPGVALLVLYASFPR